MGMHLPSDGEVSCLKSRGWSLMELPWLPRYVCTEVWEPGRKEGRGEGVGKIYVDICVVGLGGGVSEERVRISFGRGRRDLARWLW